MEVQLSAMYTNHATKQLITWAKINRREECDECLARQHETHGATTRSPARHTRRTPRAALHLCAAHAELWRARDRDT